MANNSPPAPNARHESIPGHSTIDSTSNDSASTVPERQTTPITVHVPPSQTTALGRSNRHRASLAALLLAPLVAIPPATRVLVDHAAPTVADAASFALEHAFAWRPVASPAENDARGADAEPLHITGAEAPSAFFGPSPRSYGSETSADPSSAARSSDAALKQVARGIMVRADAVARAVQSGGRPSSAAAPASGSRPAGLSLVGVSHYGTGLRDGDVLTSVGGTPATSEGAVIGAVAGAISHGAKVITGVVWRGEQRLDVAVEIPGPDAFAKPRRTTSVHN